MPNESKSSELSDPIPQNGIPLHKKKIEWKEYKLGDVAEIVGGGTPSTTNKDYWDGDIPWLSPRDLTGYNRVYIEKGARNITREGLKNSSTRLLPTGTVLFSSRAPIGYVAIAQNEICTNQGFKSLVCNSDKLWNVFAYYWLRANTEYLQSLGTGTTFAEISGSVMKSIAVSLPPLSEQKRIASILGSLDDKIDLLHRENATLEAMAETLFRHHFIENPNPNWKEGKLGDYVLGTVGGDWGKENLENDFVKPVQCIRGTDIADLNVGIASKTPIRFIKESKFLKIEPQLGDIIMEISGGTETQSTGRIICIGDKIKALFDYPIVFSNFCRLLRVKKNFSYFLYNYLQYLYNQGEFFGLESGSSGIKNLNYKALLYERTFPMPKDEVQIFEFNKAVSCYYKKICINKLQIKNIINLRKLLSKKLLSS